MTRTVSPSLAAPATTLGLRRRRRDLPLLLEEARVCSTRVVLTRPPTGRSPTSLCSAETGT